MDRDAMTPHREVLVTDQVYDTIADATDDGHNRDTETGGSLLCHEDSQGLLCAYALPPGPAARRGPVSVRTDADYQNAAMAQVERRRPGLRYAGDWHVHPMWLPTLSGTDRDTARAILRGEHPRRDELVLLLGSYRPGHGPVVLCFLARISPDQALVIDQVPLRLVDSNGPEVRQRLGDALPDLSELLAGPEPELVAHVAGERIRRDLDEIRQALGAQGELWVHDDGLFAKLRRGPSHALVVFPPDYPSGAPQVFAGTPAGFLEPIGLPYAWSSAHRLLDPVSVALTPPLVRAMRATKKAARLGLHWLRRSLFFRREEWS